MRPHFPRALFFLAALACCLSLSGCFADAGLAAAKTATLQANAAKNAIKVKDENVKKLNESIAMQAARNAQLLTQIQQQAENPEPAPEPSK